MQVYTIQPLMHVVHKYLAQFVFCQYYYKIEIKVVVFYTLVLIPHPSSSHVQFHAPIQHVHMRCH